MSNTITMKQTEIQLIKVNEQHLPALKEISIRIFTESFSHQNSPENMAAYLSKAFTEGITYLRNVL